MRTVAPGTRITGLLSSGTAFGHRTRAMLHRWPVAVSAVRTGAGNLARAIQALSPLKVQTLMVGSVGFGAGLSLGRLPRVVKAIGVAPAIVLGASMLGRQDRVSSMRSPDQGVGKVLHDLQ